MTSGFLRSEVPRKMAGVPIDRAIFKQIFEEHWDAFKASCPRFDTPYYDEVIGKMLDCGDPEKTGWAEFTCLSCGETRRVGFTCKSCFCLSCAQSYADRWVDFVSERLFPVTYRHIVLTVPEFLRPWFYRDPSLLSPLMKAGYACLREVFALSAHHELDIGAIIVLQTAGRSANYNPHLHILVTGGGLDPQGAWDSVTFIPYGVLHRKWQYHLLNLLKDHVKDPRIKDATERGWQDYPRGFVAYVQPGEVPPGGGGLARYLAKYLVSPPISLRRIEEYDGAEVRYWYRDPKSRQIEHVTLPVLKFIGRMVQNILPKGMQRIRYYGLHGNACQARMRQILASVLPPDAPTDSEGFRVRAPKRYAQRCRESFGQDPLLCPRCGKEMELTGIYHPRYGMIWSHFESLFAEIPDDEPTSPAAPAGRALYRPQQMVQLPLPFM